MSTPYVNADHGTAPFVVQGQKVHFGQSLEVEAGGWTKGEVQPRGCRDAFWAVLFYVHIGLVGYATARFVPIMAQDVAQDYGGGAQRSLEQDADGGGFSIDKDTVLLILGTAGLAGIVLTSMALVFMMKFATCLIKTALIFNMVLTAVMAVLAMIGGVVGLAIVFGIGFLLSAYYCYIVWSKIPFSASTLITATTAVKANIGLAFFSYTNLFVTFLWSFWWAIAFIATSYVKGDCGADGTCNNDINGGMVFLFLVSYFWTAQVIKNVVHTTVAGTVGTFWFTPREANGCCSRGVRDSYVRSITTSFGSICLGSLIVALIQAAKEMIHSMRHQGDSMMYCLAECLLGCIESLAQYFNQWAFVYVGLYGYTFMEAGKNVMQLFQSRGWTSIIADMMIDTVLLLVSLGVAVLTGVVGIIVGGIAEQDSTILVGAFFIGAVIGFILCSTLFSPISSAVNATIVLFAEAPAELEQNHPLLSEQMREAWKVAYPTEFRY
jgi:hypothetical protein